MNGASNSLGGSTGGSVSTGNPQNIGSQSIANTQTNLQNTNTNLFSGTQLRLTDPNGQPVVASNTSTTKITKVQTPHSNHQAIIIGASAVFIVIVFITTWLINRQASQL